MSEPLETPPLAACRQVADAVALADPVRLAAMRTELVEFLECAGDFMAVQARVIAGDAKANARPFGSPEDRAGARSLGAILESGRAFARAVEVGEAQALIERSLRPPVIATPAAPPADRADFIAMAKRVAWAVYFFALGLGLGLANGR